jgi:acetamidase/formamidase
MPRHHQLLPTPETVHWGFFDAALQPVMNIDSGDTIEIDTVSGGRQEVGDISHFRPEHRRIAETVQQGPGPHILTGPIGVRGAEPGDTLEVRIQSIELTEDWGWNVIRPHRGALPEDFPYLSRRTIPIDRQAMLARLPREYGGNIDNKEFIVGTSLFLPVFVPEAKFSVGDGHAVQGDGEVCLTALETCLKGRFEIVLHKQRLNFPRAITPTHYIAMGMDLDLDDAAKQALRNMIAWLVELTGWSAEEAYVFCSLACDLRVTQLVDGNKGIHAMVSRSLISAKTE